MMPLFGLETEYGIAMPSRRRPATPCFAASFGAALDLVDTVRGMLPGLPDETPAGAFLSNGSRIYVDNGHPELATPEVSTPWELVRCTLAGERLLARALARWRGAPNRPRPILFKSNVDHLGHQSWGCHESILCGQGAFAAPELLIPHLVSRVVFTGAGGFEPHSPGISFVLSPRALFLTASVSSSTQGNRGIVHDKDEPLGGGGHRRLHLICGESLCSERAMWLKAATTVMVVAMIDRGLDREEALTLATPVAALHAIVRDPSCRARVRLADGREMTALELQRHYLRAAEARAGAAWMPDWTQAACEYWRAMLDELEHAPQSVATTLDWGIKRALFGRVLARHGFDWVLAARLTAALTTAMDASAGAWRDAAPADAKRPQDSESDPNAEAVRIEAALHAGGFDRDQQAAFVRARRALFECDLRFGQLGGRGLFEALDRDGVLTHHAPGVDEVESLVERPPAEGRAHVRGEAIRRLANDNRRFACDWDYIHSANADTFLDLRDPFEREERWRPASELPEWARGERGPRQGVAIDWRAYNLRDEALEHFLAGRCDEAESALAALLADGFDIPSTHCHLARVQLMTGRVDEARRHVAQAWEARASAPPYVVARVAWLQTLLAVMDDGDAQPWLGTMKGLSFDRAQMQGWAMEPLLQRLQRRLPFGDFEMLSALYSVVSGAADCRELDRFAWWTAA